MRWLFIILALLVADTASSQTPTICRIIIDWTSIKNSDSDEISIRIFKENVLIHYNQSVIHPPYVAYCSLNEKDNIHIEIRNKKGIISQHELKKLPADTLLHLSVNLTKTPQELEEIIIQKPGNYKKGDTSFFVSEAYKQKQDRSLEDLIKRLPFFQLSESGQISYKGKPIRMIKIQGEELFADQTALLIQQIPLHVLKNVEVIENQSAESGLKGIKKAGEVFINLSLNETYRNKMWGKVVVGSGFDDKPRYHFQSGIFSLRTGMKGAWICRHHNTGNTIKEIEILQQKTSNVLLLLSETGFSPAIMKPIELDEKYLIRNQLSTHQLQLTRNFKKKHQLHLDYNFSTDRIRQNSTSSLSGFSGNQFISRIWEGENSWRPVFQKARIKYRLEPNPVQWVIFSVSLLRENDQPASDFKLIELSQSVSSSQRNNQKVETILIETDWYYKKKDGRVRHLNFVAETTQFERGILLSSDTALSAFNIPSKYQKRFLQNYGHRIQRIRSSSELLGQHHRKPLSVLWEIKGEKHSLNSNLYGGEGKTDTSNFKIKEFCNTATFFSGEFLLIQQKDIKAKSGFGKVSGRAGMATTVISENSKSFVRKTFPVFQLQSEYERNYKRLGMFRGFVLFSQKKREITDLHAGSYPRQSLNFISNTAPAYYERFGYLSLSFWSLSGKKIQLQFESGSDIKLISPLLSYEINGPFSFSQISQIRRPTKAFNLSGSLICNLIPKQLKLKFSYNKEIREQMIYYNRKNLYFLSRMHSATFFLDAQLFKKCQFKSSFKLEKIETTFPNTVIREAGLQNIQFRQENELFCKILENLSVDLKTYNLGNFSVKNLFLKNLMAGATLSYKAGAMKELFLEANNLLNVNNLILFRTESGPNQSFLSLPLMPRFYQIRFTLQF
jgi:hypothetical protein